jgi:uncharacterized protein
MKKISILIKPASSLCNLRCKYCFYANVSSIREVKTYGRMKRDVVDKLIKNVFSELDRGDLISIAFQGGEPTLAGLNYFKYFIELVNKEKKQGVAVRYVLQTNGMIINEKWCDFLRKNNFLVGLSFDGTPIYHDLNRLDLHGRGTSFRVLKTKELFDEFKIPYNILCVLTNPLAKHPKKVFNFFKEKNIKYVQFIPCLDGLDKSIEGKRSPYALTPERFASFYREYFQLWLKELENGNYRSVKIFDDIINLFVYGKVTACGINGRCGIQLIIEGDGSVYPCDFYALDEYRLGYIQTDSLQQLLNNPIASSFLNNAKREIPEYCLSCPFKNICCGGCKRMKDAMYVSKKGNFCGYRVLLETLLPNEKLILHNVEIIKESMRS